METHLWMLVYIEHHQKDCIDSMEKRFDIFLHYVHHMDITRRNIVDQLATM